MRSRHCGELNRGLQNLEAFRKGTILFFLHRAKSNQKARARTHKKLPVASFCASETAETGRIANGREQGDHVSRSRLRPATSIQIAGRTVIVAKMTGFHKVTGNAENGIFPGIAGNDLNRCEVRALQNKIRAKSKRTTVFFANSRLRAVGRGGGGQKRLLWVAVKKVCAKENLLVCENGRFLKPARKGTCKKKFLCVKNGFE